MSYTILFVWVEGDDDERLFNFLSKHLLEQRYYQIQVKKYAKEKHEKIDKFIRSIKAMGSEYIFVCDIDQSSCITIKKQELQKRYKNLEVDRILVIIKEIESWYAAGISQEECKRLGIKYSHFTDNITKEDFNNLIPQKYKSRIDFMIELIKFFSIDLAKSRNTSFQYFIHKYTEQT